MRDMRAGLIPTDGLPMHDDRHLNMAGHKGWAERAFMIMTAEELDAVGTSLTASRLLLAAAVLAAACSSGGDGGGSGGSGGTSGTRRIGRDPEAAGARR